MRNLFIFPERLQASSRHSGKVKKYPCKERISFIHRLCRDSSIMGRTSGRGNTKSIPFSPQNKRYPDGPGKR